MADQLTHNGESIDTLSQVLLQVLRDSGGRATASKLKREAGVDDTKQVHYRFNQYLIPAGLAEKDGSEEVQGSPFESTVYKLTDEGIGWLAANEDDVLDAVGSAKAVESIRRMEDTVADFSTQVAELEEELEEVDDFMNRYSTRVSRLKNTVEDVEDAVIGAADQESVAELQEQVEELERDVDAIQGWISDADDTVDELESNVSGVEGQLADLEERVKESFKNVDEKLSVLYENQQEIVKRLNKAGVETSDLLNRFS